MLKSLKLPTALVISLFCLATRVQADEPLLDGVRPFICDGEAAVLLQTDNGWAITHEPNIEVSELRNGWRFGDQGMGFIGYLKAYEQDDWTLEFLSDGGYEEVSCIDLTESVSEVVTAIKPRLDEAIVETQEALSEATRNLRIAEQNKERLLEDHKTELIQRQEAHRTELIQTQDAHRNELLRLQQEKLRVEQEKLRVEAALEDALSNLKSAEFLYRNSYKLRDGGEGTIAAALSHLQTMSLPARKSIIAESSLGNTAFQKNGFPVCVGRLRDEGALSSFCLGVLVEYLSTEGW